MKKIGLITLLVLVSVFVLADVLYTYEGADDIWFNGEILENGDTVVVDNFMYMDDFTLTSSTPTSIIVASESVSTTDALTTTITFDELLDAKLTIEPDTSNSVNLTLYFNETSTTPITVSEDFEYEFNTLYVGRLYVTTPVSTTAVADEDADGSATSWAVDSTPIVPGTFDVTVDASSGSTTDDGSTGFITGVGTIVYATGVLTLAESASTITADYTYYDETNYTITVKRVF